MGCVEEGRRVDDEGVKGVSAWSRKRRSARPGAELRAARPRQRKGRKNRRVFERLRHGDIHIQF